MDIKKNAPKTLLQAVRCFKNRDICQDFMMAVRWPDNQVTCPRCGSKEVTYLENARLWKCRTKHPQQKFSIKVGTIFEDSPIGLEKWLPVAWLLANCKNGISSMEVHRALGVTQKTAWFMLHRVRKAMQTGTFDKMMGEVEADETFIGGLARNMHKKDRDRKIKGTGGSGKQIVMGLLDRKTRKVHVEHVPNTQATTLHGVIRGRVAPGAHVHTDEYVGYNPLDKDVDYLHSVINHVASYVRGTVHTNGIENFWSLLKRGLKGTYVSVEPFHLHRYLDEQAFRFNERKNEDGDQGRFVEVLRNIVGRRVTYKELTGNTGLGAVPLGSTPA
jgi:transposase-like protein